MSTIDEAIYYILSHNSGITALVSTRIYAQNLPLNCTLPALSFSSPSDPYHRIVGKPRFQIDCFDDDYLGVITLKEAVEAALDGYAGTASGINIEFIAPLLATKFYYPDIKTHHIAYDFKVIYRR